VAYCVIEAIQIPSIKHSRIRKTKPPDIFVGYIDGGWFGRFAIQVRFLSH